MSLDRYRRVRMIVLPSSSSAADAARAMARHGVDAVLVREGAASSARRDGASPGASIAGIVTDRDLVLGLLAGGLDPDATRLDEIMSRDVATIDVSANLADVARIMRQRACRRLPITEDGCPVGLVTLDDLLLDGDLPQPMRLIIAAQLDAAQQSGAAQRRDGPGLHEGARHPAQNTAYAA